MKKSIILIVIVSAALVISLVIKFSVNAYKEKQLHDDLISKIESVIIPKLNYYQSYSNAGREDSNLIIYCSDEFDTLTNQEKYDYLNNTQRRFDTIHSNYMYEKVYKGENNITNYDIVLSNTTIMTSKNEYKIDSLGYFYENGTQNYDLSRDNINKETASSVSSSSSSVTPYYSGSDSLTDKDKQRYISIAKEQINNILKAPSSAKFPWGSDDYTVTKKGNDITITGYVEAENSFGAKLKSNFRVKIELVSDKEYIVKEKTVD